MSSMDRVAWLEGLFVEPQHFQQQERYLEHQIVENAALRCAWHWGFSRWQIDLGALQQGCLALTDIHAAFEDGSVIDAPAFDSLPEPLDLKRIAADVRNQRIYLVLPKRLTGELEFDGLMHEGKLARPAQARYIAQEVTNAVDNTGSASPASMVIGRLQSRLVRADEVTGQFTALPVAEISEVRDGVVVLSETFIPPLLACQASPLFVKEVRKVERELRTLAQDFASRRSSPGKTTVNGLLEFLILQCFNRVWPQVKHVAENFRMHPEPVFSRLTGLAGELRTFHGTRLAADLPRYDHDNPHAAFAPLFEDLHISLRSFISVQEATQVEVAPQQDGFHVAILGEKETHLLRSGARMVLSVKADSPADDLRNGVLKMFRLASIRKIAAIVDSNSPGLAFQGLSETPKEMPFHAGFQYFEIDRGHSLWPDVIESAGLGLHVIGHFPGLQLALWVVHPVTT